MNRFKSRRKMHTQLLNKKKIFQLFLKNYSITTSLVSSKDRYLILSTNQQQLSLKQTTKLSIIIENIYLRVVIIYIDRVRMSKQYDMDNRLYFSIGFNEKLSPNITIIHCSVLWLASIINSIIYHSMFTKLATDIA
jgi:hypothetical protein